MPVELGPRAKGVVIPSEKSACTQCGAVPGKDWAEAVDEYGIKRYKCSSCGANYRRKPNLPPRRAYKDTRAMGLICEECRYWLKKDDSEGETRFCLIFEVQTKNDFACSVFERPL